MLACILTVKTRKRQLSPDSRARMATMAAYTRAARKWGCDEEVLTYKSIAEKFGCSERQAYCASSPKCFSMTIVSYTL